MEVPRKAGRTPSSLGPTFKECAMMNVVVPRRVDDVWGSRGRGGRGEGHGVPPEVPPQERHRGLGPNSIETFWVEFWLEKRTEIPF